MTIFVHESNKGETKLLPILLSTIRLPNNVLIGYLLPVLSEQPIRTLKRRKGVGWAAILFPVHSGPGYSGNIVCFAVVVARYCCRAAHIEDTVARMAA